MHQFALYGDDSSDCSDGIIAPDFDSRDRAMAQQEFEKMISRRKLLPYDIRRQRETEEYYHPLPDPWEQMERTDWEERDWDEPPQTWAHQYEESL